MVLVIESSRQVAREAGTGIVLVQSFAVRWQHEPQRCLGTEKKNAQVSYRALNARGRRICASVCYFINKIPKFIFKKRKEVNLQI
jgi:hypothetical protein